MNVIRLASSIRVMATLVGAMQGVDNLYMSSGPTSKANNLYHFYFTSCNTQPLLNLVGTPRKSYLMRVFAAGFIICVCCF
jgi:hypothetical protein